MGDRTDLPEGIRARRGALVIGHPGHELRVHGWLEAARPLVAVLTDGSKFAERSRVEATRRVLRDAGARASDVFGVLGDQQAYVAILEGRIDRFVRLAERVAAALVAEGAEYVVTDGLEGINPVHDLCRSLAHAAARLAGCERRAGTPLDCFEIPLVGHPARGVHGAGEVPERVVLGAPALARKLAAARRYAELEDEVESAIASLGADAFAEELLYPVDPESAEHVPPGPIPIYERVGQARVATGRYRRVLGYRDHVRPVAEALARLGAPGAAACAS